MLPATDQAARKGQNLLEQALRIAQASGRSHPDRLISLLRLVAKTHGLSAATIYLPDPHFDALTRRDEEAAILLGVDKLAAAVHRFYREKGIREKWISKQHDHDFAALSTFDQASNRAAARRIPAILAMAGLRLAPGVATSEERAQADTALVIQAEFLGEAEHDGWMQWHFDNGWVKSDHRADELQLHDLLVPYRNLTPRNKAKDTNAILHYPDIAQLAEMKIVPVTPLTAGPG